MVVALAVTGVLLAAMPASARVPLRGVAVQSLWAQFPDGDIDRDLDLARAAGSTVVKVDIAWASLEVKGKGDISQWYLQRMDRFVAGAKARGMKVIATLWASPCWASSAPAELKRGCTQDWNPDTVAYPPSNPADFGDIARFVTARYGNQLAALEIWNEPNLVDELYWKTRDKAGDYAKLVRAAYAPAKAGNRTVSVLIGSLVRADKSFLRMLYADGVKGYFDGISVHSYGVELTPQKLDPFHAAQVKARDKTGIWITEWGEPTGTSSQWSVGERTQARTITQGMATMDRLSYIRGATLYGLRDLGTDPASMEQNFGVLRNDYSPKLSWPALQTALRSRPRTSLRCRASTRSRATRPRSKSRSCRR
jgi:O-glycosyl hydrolase